MIRGMARVLALGIAAAVVLPAGYGAVHGAPVEERVEKVQVWELPEQDPELEPEELGPHSTNLGEFKLTAYCACSECCGKSVWDPNYGITATGTVCEEGRTVAVDPEVIPMGSVLYIGGNRYIAEDVGGAVQGRHIDIYFESHEDALEFGVQWADVYIWR